MSDPAVIVLIVLAAVAIFAVGFAPRGFYGEWVTLSRLFATDRRPANFSHPNQKLFFSPIMPWWHAWTRVSSGEYCSFDVEMDGEGMWLRYQGPEPKRCADCLFIPWSEIAGASRVGDLVKLQLNTRRNISIEMPPALGKAALAALP